MWRSWSISSSSSSSPSSESHSRKDNNNNNNNNKLHSFRCSSFKDIDILSDSTLSNLKQPQQQQQQQQSTNTIPRRSVFHRVRTANSLIRQWPSRSTLTQPQHEPDPRIVVYYTSLRVIRSTFDACQSVQSILYGFRVAIDERDLAMDSGFLTELRDLLGLKNNDELRMPRVFIGGRYIGGADEVMHLHEIGELKKLVDGLPIPKKAGACSTCGGYRFILCIHCSGSHKIYYSDKIGFRSCKACNENGLCRCPQCSSPPPRLL